MAAASRYLGSHAALTCLGLAAVAALNVTADVYGHFGTPRWRRINDEYRIAGDGNGDRALPMAGRRRAVHHDRHPILLLGTSTTVYGFDTRRLASAFNAGLPGASLQESVDVAMAAFGRPIPPTIILMEASALGPPVAPSAPPATYDWLLALGTTRVSLRVLAASVRGVPGDRHVGDFFDTDVGPSAGQARRVLDDAAAALLASLAASSADGGATPRVLDALRGACAAARGTVVLFVPPRHPAVLALPGLARMHAEWVRALREAISSLAPVPGCQLRLLDLSSPDGDWGPAGSGTPWSAQDFTSLTHFRPALGARVFGRLLGEAESARAARAPTPAAGPTPRSP